MTWCRFKRPNVLLARNIQLHATKEGPGVAMPKPRRYVLLAAFFLRFSGLPHSKHQVQKLSSLKRFFPLEVHQVNQRESLKISVQPTGERAGVLLEDFSQDENWLAVDLFLVTEQQKVLHGRRKELLGRLQ